MRYIVDLADRTVTVEFELDELLTLSIAMGSYGAGGAAPDFIKLLRTIGAIFEAADKLPPGLSYAPRP